MSQIDADLPKVLASVTNGDQLRAMHHSGLVKIIDAKMEYGKHTQTENAGKVLQQRLAESIECGQRLEKCFDEVLMQLRNSMGKFDSSEIAAAEVVQATNASAGNGKVNVSQI